MDTSAYLHRFTLLLLIIISCSLGLTEAMAGGNKKFMSIRKAKAMAQRALIESTIGLKLHSNELWTTSGGDNYQVLAESSATIQGVIFDTPKYDSTKDIAMISARIRLSKIKNIISKPISYENMSISRVGFATSSPQSKSQLQALRAAELNAYDEMAKLLTGSEVSSKTEMNNFVLESDEIRTKTQAALWGTEVSDFGWEEDGTAYIKLTLNAKWIADILGRESQEKIYEVTGYGAMYDSSATINIKNLPEIRSSQH